MSGKSAKIIRRKLDKEIPKIQRDAIDRFMKLAMNQPFRERLRFAIRLVRGK